jgi:hypothetical protein
MRYLAAAIVVGALLAGAPASADLTITQSVAGKIGPVSADGDSVTYLKGTRMRTDSKVSNRDVSTIIDLEKRQFVSLNHEKKEAEITDMSAVAQSLQQIGASDMTVSLTPTGNKKEVLGHGCEDHAVSIKVPFQPPKGSGGGDGPVLIIAMGGPACLSATAPGRDDYAKFYTAAAEQGLFITDPRQAKASPGQAKGMMEMYRAMAKAGMPLTSELNIGFEGGGPLAGMMGRMGGSKLTSRVTKLSTDAVADSVFEIPAGYKVKGK